MKTSYSFISLVALLLLSFQVVAVPPREFYELRTYRFKTPEQQDRTENYLRQALLPTLHRAAGHSANALKNN